MPEHSIQVDKLSMVGTNGGKFPAIRTHLQENIAQVYKNMDISYVPRSRSGSTRKP